LCGRENAMHITPMLFKENVLKININTGWELKWENYYYQ
jgi:hypothetical protein